MSEMNGKLKAISGKMSEHIAAVKGTLELADASLSEDDLHTLLLKAMERMDDMEKLSNDMLALINQLLEKVEETIRAQKFNEPKE